MRWPVGRPTTVRTRIVALALAPVVALMALWTFAMVSVTAELRALIRLQGVYEDFGTPVDTAVGQIQIERRLSAAYLGASHDTDAAGELLAQQRRTDRAVSAMRDAIQDGDRSRLTGTQRESLETMLRVSDGLDPLRDRVLSRKLTWDRAVTEYGAIVEPGFDAESALTALQAGQLARESQVVIELVRVREFVSREDALVAGARAAGTLTDRQYDTLTATIEDRRVFEHTYVPDLPADSRALFESFQRGELHRSLVEGEDALLRAGPARAGKAVAADTWRTTTDRAVKRYMELCTQSAENSAARGRDFAYGELTKAAVAGFVGLAAVGLSLWFSVRGARRISRRLETLRDDADLLATRQLPDVMRRLSAGDDVDAVAEAPPLAAEEGDADEIDQVGRSFNSARLAAVEAAVTQATLRRGLFAVLLNIARRNQALVHRQLKLVDTLERRTDDPEILGQLFGIDHLTTRMRRHAESLIILSGAVPGRRWRRPVPVADVVSSAVGEIEDYTRVVVPPMPEIGVAADAVADVVHLIAELLENATVFSPPHTQVTVRTGRVSGGFVVEIDDRGLGLDPDQLADAQRTLTDPDAFDPTRHDRLGLYVVGRLAARHDIQVTLRDSPYGGTTAVVLLPSTVLAPVTPPGPDPAAPTDDATPEDARTPGRAVPEARTPDIARPANGTGEVHDTGRPLTDRVPAPEDARTPGRAVPEARTPDTARPAHRTGEAHDTARPLSDRVPEHHVAGAPGPAEPPAGHDRAPGPLTHGVREGAPSSGHDGGRGPVGSGGTAPAGTEGSGGAPAPAGPPASALPRRVRQASLAAPLRDEPPARDATPEREVDAEEMRAVFGSFQRGLERGRQGLPTRRDGDEGTEADHAQ